MDTHLHGPAMFRLLALFALGGLSVGTSPALQPPAPDVHVQMNGVFYHFSERIAVHIFQLEGAVVPTAKGTVPVFDDPKSFLIAIRSAKISIGANSLSETLNRHVFARKDAPLKNLQVSIEGGKIKVKGKLHSKGDIPFETVGTLSATPDGKVRIHAEHVKAAHLPVKGLMELLGLDIAKLISTSKVRGVKAEGNDLILDPQEILPLPHITGKLMALQIAGDDIVQIFGQPQRLAAKAPGNYMSYRGGELQFGKLTMHDSDMDLIDMDPKDWFDFYLDHYKEQLSAGYTKITPQFGLRVYMRDYNKLHAATSQPKPR